MSRAQPTGNFCSIHAIITVVDVSNSWDPEKDSPAIRKLLPTVM